MSSLLKEVLEYLEQLQHRQWEQATRADRSSDDRRIYRERAWVIREASEELKKRYT